MNEDKIDIHGSWRGMGDYQKDCLLLDIQIRLNGVPVSWGHVDIYSLALYSLNHKSKHYPNSAWSNFEPFSCSCGVAGCAGIWDGIHVKVRRNSVEWRAKKEDGYGFLGKSFFSFDKEHYMQALNKFFFWLMMEVDYDCKLCVDLGYYEGDEFTVDQFFDWLEKNK